jgi:hypothetical protein
MTTDRDLLRDTADLIERYLTLGWNWYGQERVELDWTIMLDRIQKQLATPPTDQRFIEPPIDSSHPNQE